MKINREFTPRELERLADKPGCDQMREENGLVTEPFPCLVCGNIIDEHTVQCERCGQVYFYSDLMRASAIARLRKQGVPEEFISDIFASARRQQEEEEVVNNPLLPRTPLQEMIMAKPVNDTRN